MTHIKQTHGFDALRVIHKKIPRTLKNKWKFKYSAKIKTFKEISQYNTLANEEGKLAVFYLQTKKIYIYFFEK